MTLGGTSQQTSGAQEAARRAAQAERRDERKILRDFLSSAAAADYTKEKQAALRAKFATDRPLNTEEEIAQDEKDRLEGMAEIAVARVRVHNAAKGAEGGDVDTNTEALAKVVEGLEMENKKEDDGEGADAGEQGGA